MNLNFLLLFCGISLFNVIMQTVKSLCTVRCSTFIAACVNALTYAVYVYVIVYTNAEGLSLWGKAIITACANFAGVYIANFFFNKFFTKEVNWVVSISTNITDVFIQGLNKVGLIYHDYGYNSDLTYKLIDVYCPTKEASKTLLSILPPNSIYNINENCKRL